MCAHRPLTYGHSELRTLFVFVLIAVFSAGCSDSGGDDDRVDPANIDPNLFVEEVDNPLFPLAPGSRWVYRARTEEGGDERVEVEVTNEKKAILGVPATVVKDRVFSDGEVTEDTNDWFAQDVNGNVWYFGEDTKELEEGRVISTAGSWEAGVNGARPGIIMFADPVDEPGPGTAYNQEFAPGVAEDMAEIVARDVSVTVAAGSFEGCLQTRDFTPLDPQANEHKFYCPGVGLVRTLSVGAPVSQAEDLERLSISRSGSDTALGNL